MVANVTAEQIEAKKARVAEALRLHDEGLSIKQTAELMGVAYETVRRYLRASGIPLVKKSTNKGTRKLPCGSLKHCSSLIRMLIVDGIAANEIAKVIGCSPSTVTNFKSRHGMTDYKLYSVETKREAVRLVLSGMSDYQVADMLGVNHGTVGNWARAAGIVRGKGGGCVARNNEARSSKAAPKRMARVRDAIGESFEVVRETRKDWFLLRCRECGHEFERRVDLHCKTTCPECMRLEVERHKEEHRAKSEQEQKRALMQRLVNLLAYEHVCPECGRKFRHSNPYKVYCTARCAQHHKGNGDSVKRAKKNGAEYDCSISLDKLIDRDGLACYLCGKTCTKEDKRWGTFGPDYPTIDHVIPLSKGGSHTWDNVKVACGECNCVVKGAKVLAS